MWKCLLIFAVLAVASAIQHEHQKDSKFEKPKRSYVCPPHFMRLSNKCYYFSNKTATFQDAYWKCRDMHSNIATIKNGNQDKILRRTLDHDGLVPLERWVGGRYDWGTMSWKWAASGKPVQYQGFAEPQTPHTKETLIWHCIVLDPAKHYRWTARSCTDEKHYICQTKIRTVNNKDKKKMQKQYNSELNEVAVPEIQSNHIGNITTRYNKFSLYDNNELSNLAFARRPKEIKIRRKDKKDTGINRSYNSTATETVGKRERNREKKNRRNKRKRNGKAKHNSIDKIRYKTYFEGNINPLHPRVAVEEFSYS